MSVRLLCPFRMHTGHILRLLATHHIIRECEPDTFALNRVSALLDSGRSFTECRSAYVVLSVTHFIGNWCSCFSPVKKYDGEYGAIAALAALKYVSLESQPVRSRTRSFTVPTSFSKHRHTLRMRSYLL